MKKDQPGPGAPSDVNSPSGERIQFNLRMTAETRTKLQEAARRSGRSLSQEAELRLESSFERGELLADVLRLAFGAEPAAIFLGIAAVMTAVGREAAFKKGGLKAASEWMDDAYSFAQASEAARLFIASATPPGEAVGPQFKWMAGAFTLEDDVLESLEKYERDRARLHVEELVRKAQGRSEKKIFAQEALAIRNLSPELADRLNGEGKPNGDR